ncbi:MAG: hypothetical protein WBM62_07060, partial [Crocosphaera sp.]
MWSWLNCRYENSKVDPFSLSKLTLSKGNPDLQSIGQFFLSTLTDNKHKVNTMTMHNFLGLSIATVVLSSAPIVSAATILSTDFDGRTISGNTASNIDYT